MRTVANRADIAAAEGHWCFAYLEVTADDGSWTNLGALLVGTETLDFFNTFRLAESIDSNTLSFSATLKRDIGPNSLSPFRTDSPINMSEVSPGLYAPRLDLARLWRIILAVVASDTVPVMPDDYVELNAGVIEKLVIHGLSDTVDVEGMGMESPILKAFVLKDRAYSGDLEDVIQEALDDQFGTDVIPLYTPVSPSVIAEVTIGDTNLMPVLSDTAAVTAGWSLRYRYDAAHVNRFTLFEPPRGSVTPDWSITGTEYEELEVEVDLSGVRNFIPVTYFDVASGAAATVVSPGAETGTLEATAGAGTFSTSQAGIVEVGAKLVIDRTGSGDFVAYTVLTFDGTTGVTLEGDPTFTAREFYTSASITKYGLQVFGYDLSADTQLTAEDRAQAFADFVRADREDPAMVQRFRASGLWFVQLHDVVALAANGVHYDQDQSGGVTAYSMVGANGMLDVTIDLAGYPKGRYTTWKRIGSGAPASTLLPTATASGTFIDGTNYTSDVPKLQLNIVMGFRTLSVQTQWYEDEALTIPWGVEVGFDRATDGDTISFQWGLADDTERNTTYWAKVTPWSGPIVAGPGFTGVAGRPVIVPLYAGTQMTPQASFDVLDATVTTLDADLTALAEEPFTVWDDTPGLPNARKWVDTPTATIDLTTPGEVKVNVVSGGGGGVAPDDAEYIVKSASGDLSAERVLTDTTTVTADYGTAGQVKLEVPDGSLGVAKLSATGTPSSSNFLRGDNTWASAAGSVGWRYSVARGVVANGTYADMVSAQFTTGAVFLVAIRASRLAFTGSAFFVVPVQDNGGSSLWGIVRAYAHSSSGAVIGLEIQYSAGTTVAFRVRNDDSQNFDGVRMTVTCVSEDAPTFATLSSTGAISTTGLYTFDRIRLQALDPNGATSKQPLCWNATTLKWEPLTLSYAEITGAAPLASPALTGTPTAPTATAGTNTTQLATTAFVTAAVSSFGGTIQGSAYRAMLRTSGNVAASTIGSYTAIPFDTEDADTDTMHSTVTNTSRITINTAGTYSLAGWYTSTGGVSGQQIIALRKNGSTLLATQAVNPGGNGVHISVSVRVDLSASDYIELLYYTSNSFTIAAGATFTAVKLA